MKPILFLIMLGLSLTAGAQSADSLAVVKQIDSLLGRVARPMIERQKFADARLVVETARQQAETAFGKNHALYAVCLTYRGKIDQRLENFAQAESAYLEAKAIHEKVLGRDHQHYTVGLSNLSTLYLVTGAYDKAEPLLLELKEIRARTVGVGHPDYARSLNNLGMLYFHRGDYGPAELEFQEAIGIFEKTLNKDHSDYVGALTNLASIYINKADLAKAEPLFLAIKDIQAATIGKTHPLYVQTLVNLAALYSDRLNVARAEPLYREAIDIYSKVLGRESTHYALALVGLSDIYVDREDYALAEPLIREASEIYVRVFGKHHPDYAMSLVRLARIDAARGNYPAAEKGYLRALEILDRSLTTGNPKYAETLGYLALLYRETNRISEAAALLKEADERNRRLIEKASGYYSETEMSAYLRRFQDHTDAFYSLAWSQPGAGLAPAAFDNALFYKGFLLNASLQVRNRARTDTAAAARFESLGSYRRRIGVAETLPLAERDSAGLAQLEAKANMLEKELIRSVVGYGEALRQVRWQEVQEKLPPNAAAVEFVHFQKQTLHGKPTDTTLYGALVLRSGAAPPVFVPLFEERALTALIAGASGGNVRKINALYGTDAGAGSLYGLIWKKLEKPLQGADMIWCTPSGLLHRLNLDAIIRLGGESWAGQHQLARLGSTRQLVAADRAAAGFSSDAGLMGGVRYAPNEIAIKASTQSLGQTRAQPDAETSPFPADSLLRGDTWSYLPGTAAEVADLRRLLESTGLSVRLDTGYAATEEAVKLFGRPGGAPAPRVLHFATHGYFFPDPPAPILAAAHEPVFKTSGNPLLRSGLILAGAQQVWTTGRPPADREDGVLTAAEISRMNLSGTELVVLSACETGLGDLRGTEGVYGLQRAFKIAGAKYVVMSLWKVNDRSTREFMTDFYSQWLEKRLAIPEAFHRAQQNMKLRYPADAYHWAGFVLME